MSFFKSFVFSLVLFIPVAYADHYASFAIKGGISLGSYEAGLNWVFIEEIRRREFELNTFTGASAGGINAIISAVRACQIDDKPDVKNNIFRRAWNINIDDIAPLEDQTEFDYTDIIDNFDEYVRREVNVKGLDKGGLFTRKGLLNSVSLVYEEIKNKTYKEGCEVNIGIAVTKFFPEVMTIKGVSLKNQRFIFPIKLSVKNNKVVFQNLNANKHDFVSLDHYLYLPEQEDDTVAIYEVLKLALASSAFPVAFAPVNLHYCKPAKNVLATDRKDCPANYEIKHDLFLDGGSFDNAPIGTTLTLTEYSLNNKSHAGGNNHHEETVSYGYINPGNMREPGKNIHADRKKFEGNANEYIAGITDYMYLASNIMDYGMNAELSKALQRYNTSNPKNMFYITSRFYPLVGDYLYHFAAFFDDAFRDFDFNVGVYDGVINAARYDCMVKNNNGKTDAEYFATDEAKKCIGEKTEDVYKNLMIASGDGKDIFAALAKREFGEHLATAEWQWLDVDETLKNNRYSKNINIFMALDDSGCSLTSHCKNDVKPTSFKTFISRLDVDRHKYGALVEGLKEKPDDWLYPVLASTIDRQYKVEQIKYNYLKDNDQLSLADDQEVFIKTLEAVGLIARTVASRRDIGYWPRSTVMKPSWWMSIVPDEVGGDVRNGGIYFAYNNIKQLGTDKPVVLETSFIPFHDLNDSIYPSENSSLDFTLRYHRSSPGFSSFGAGVIAYADWHKQPDVSRYSYGMTLDAGMLGDKIRVTLLYRYIDDLEESQYSLLFGITDFKGFSYWLFN